MADEPGGSVKVQLEGTHLLVDARPARLVSLLRGPGGDPVLTAQRTEGGSHTESVPAEARLVTFQVHDDLSVEATRASDFVALAEDGGRRVVVAFTGEVTVLPGGAAGDRFALGAHEALLMPADGAEPRVVAVDDLSEADQDEISGVMEAAALATVATREEEVAESPTEIGDEAQSAPTVVEAPEVSSEPTPPPSPVSAGAPKTPIPPARSANANKRSGKKNKKGRPQPQKRQAPLVPAAAAGAAAGVTKKATGPVTTPPVKKASGPVKKASGPAKKTAGGRPTGGGAKHTDDSYEDTPGDRRFIAGALVLAVLVVLVLGVFVLSGDDDKGSTVATDSTTTSEGSETTEEPATTAKPPTSTSAPAATSAPATTAAPTTAAPPTTTATTAAPAPKYTIEPKSCVQNADRSTTYTATITNSSTVAFDYAIKVAFKEAGGATAATADAKVTKLAPGKSVDFTATATPKSNLANAGNCTVERVDASPSGS